MRPQMLTCDARSYAFSIRNAKEMTYANRGG